MRKIKAGVLIIIFLTAVCIFSGCAETEEAAEYIEPTLASEILIDEPAQDEIMQEEPAVQAIAFIEETEEKTIGTTEKIEETTRADTTTVPATEPPVLTEPPEPKPAAAPVIIPAKPPRDNGEKWIALTFDDGPGRYTQQILDLLEYHGGKATFFVLGAYVWNQRQIIRNMIEQGSEAAGHSWHHYNLTELEEQEIKDQITYTDNAILHVTGVPPPKFFRPPFGAYDDAVKDAAREVGSAIIMWNIDSRDWRHRNADYIYDYIMERAENGAIILCHDIHETTAEAMERIIPELIEQGYKLVTVSELLGETTPGLLYYSEHRIVS